MKIWSFATWRVITASRDTPIVFSFFNKKTDCKFCTRTNVK